MPKYHKPFKQIEEYENVSLKNFCTFHIGGKAKKLYIVYSTQQLSEIIKKCNDNNIKYKIIGFGANLLFDDAGYNGAIIVNKSNKILFQGNSCLVDSGVSLSSLISKCIERNLSGLETLAGIPSTIGGGITNNVGSGDVSIADCVEYVVCFDGKKIMKLNKSKCLFSYRDSYFKHNNLIILKSKLNFQPQDKKIIQEAKSRALEYKINTQPTNEYSAGSVFKRGKIIVSKAIDELGLKGFRIGDAEISTKHAGFIINKGNATSQDVLKIIDFIKDKIKSKYNVDIETEIELVK